MKLPIGSVTFLFTDIETSTKQWEQFPEAMNPAVTRHDALMHQAIAAHRGHVIKTLGDGFYAVFANASDALAAVLAAQLALHVEPWPEPVEIRARMALHSGEAYLRDGDYYGAAANRAARLMALGHGGQTLISRATYELVRDRLPIGIRLKDLGLQRLKDLQRPEQAYQLLSAGLPESFPPLNSLDTLPNNLPLQLTSFVGWEKEIQAVKDILTGTRLLTVTGSGGCGKTRLCLQVAADLLDDYPDGVWFVEFAPLSDPALVSQSIAAALRVREEPDRPMSETLRTYIGQRRLLLLLDNCEHLLTVCVPLADSLLRSCPNLQVIATSREALGIGGETIYRVPALSLPRSVHASSAEQIGGYESVRLFLERAAAVDLAFTLNDRNAALVAQICRRLDGIPLAIELAAARVKALPMEQVAARLDDAFRILTGGSRAALPRQQTLRAAIDWSYNLLSAPEQALLRRLSVFAGGWAVEAAEAVCSGQGIDRLDIVDLLTALVEKSLVIYDEGSGRYRLLETVRQYASSSLAENGESGFVQLAHYAYFVEMAEESERKLVGAEQAQWLARMETEHDNFRAALAWCREEGEREEGRVNGVSQRAGPWGKRGEGTGMDSSFLLSPSSFSLRLAGALWRFWNIRGHLNEGRVALASALAQDDGQARTLPRAKALNAAGVLAEDQGDYDAAHALFTECLAIAREIGYRPGEAGVLGNLGNVAFERGEYDAARSYLEESLELSRELHDTWGIANKLNSLGNVAEVRADSSLASRLYQESLALFQELGDKAMIATVLGNQGLVASEAGDAALARSLHESCLAIYRDLGDKHVTIALQNLGDTACRAGDYPEARRNFEESLETAFAMSDKPRIGQLLVRIGDVDRLVGAYPAAAARLRHGLTVLREVGDKWGATSALLRMGYLATALADSERAACLFGVVEALHNAIGVPLKRDEQEEYDSHHSLLRAALGETRFAAAWHRGRAMTLNQAFAYATSDAEGA